MKILDLHILNGPNYWSVRKHNLIVIKLDLEELEQLPTNKIPGFYERLQKTIPTLFNHYCSENRAGGFFERVKNGTWMGHVLEHIALEIQSLAGISCGFGRTRQAGQQTGVYNVVFEYKEKRAGIFAAESAFKVTEALINNTPYNLKQDIETIKSFVAEYAPGPSTTSILNAAKERGIPFISIDEGSMFQLGYGKYQKRINTTITENTNSIAVDIASDKFLTKKILKNASVPVAEGLVIEQEIQMDKAIMEIGFPLVIKPLNSNHGKGVSTNLKTTPEALKAFRNAQLFSEQVIVERYYTGEDYRLLMIDYKLCAAAHRMPASVKGDGFSSIRTLVEKTNKSPLRGEKHEKVLTRIKIDDHTLEFLKRQNLTLDSVLPENQRVYLKQTANLSTGGTSEDVTEIVHPEIIAIAERTARSIGLDICGIDMVLKDISYPIKNNGVVIEVNAAPGFRMHTHPTHGKPRAVGEKVIDMLFPKKDNGRIPIVAITGTNGKTTTSRLIAHIVKSAGFNAGYTTTEGIYIGNQLIEEGDCTGPISAAKILCDKTVDFAVLECARGGILRSGLAFDMCDVGIVTNVAEDHLGLKDIETIEEMARVKSTVAESVNPDGYAVLNADNDFTYKMKDKVKSKVALFSTYPESERIKKHCEDGGLAAIYENGNIVLVKGNKKLLIDSVENIPLSFQGKALFMIENILAATLAAYATKIPVNNISLALRSFTSTAETNPGRLNFFTFNNFTLMIDYAHNYHGLIALGQLIKQWDCSYKTGIVSVAGDRRDVDIINVGKAAAQIFDEIIIRIDEDKRGRSDNEITALLLQGINKENPDLHVEVIPHEIEAIQYAIRNSPTGSLVVHLSEKIHNCIAFANHLKQEEITNAEEFVLEEVAVFSEIQKEKHTYKSTVD